MRKKIFISVILFLGIFCFPAAFGQSANSNESSFENNKLNRNSNDPFLQSIEYQQTIKNTDRELTEKEVQSLKADWLKSRKTTIKKEDTGSDSEKTESRTNTKQLAPAKSLLLSYESGVVSASDLISRVNNGTLTLEMMINGHIDQHSEFYILVKNAILNLEQ